MKRLLIALAVVGLLATSAAANQCPLLIKQLTDAMATMSPDDAKVKAARALVEQARKLHAEGRHADSIAKADEAAKVLGVTLKKA
jgi:hypothetical protein